MKIKIKPKKYYKQYYTILKRGYTILYTGTTWVYAIAYTTRSNDWKKNIIIKCDKKCKHNTIKHLQRNIISKHIIIEELSKEDLFLELL